MDTEISLPEPSMEGVELLENGGVEVNLDPITPKIDPTTVAHGDNLALYLSDEELHLIGSTLVQAVEEDALTTKDWEKLFEEGFKELGLKIEQLNEPFEGACSITHPLLLETIVKFQARAYSETLPATGPVKTRLVGAKSPAKEAQASRVQEYLNYTIMEEMPEYEDEHERTLWGMGFYGTALKKVYPDHGDKTPVSEYVPISDFIIAYNAKHLRKCDRYTHVISRLDHELQRDMANGIYRTVNLSPTQLQRSTLGALEDRARGISTPINWSGYRLYEIHTVYNIPGFEVLVNDQPVMVPYIITVDADSGTVLAIRRNWKEGDPSYRKREYFIAYKLVPSAGFHAFGYVHLIGGLAAGSTTILRALVDSGQFANLQGGFKTREFTKNPRGNEPHAPGEWRDVDIPGADLTKAILPLPYKEPSQTLYNLLIQVVAWGQKFADSTEQVIADSTNYGPVGTTMALLDASTKFQSAIHKRIHRSLKAELRLITDVVAEMLTVYPYAPGETVPAEIAIQDFSPEVDVIPVSDPNISSQAHRLLRATTLQQMAQGAPGIYDVREVHRRAVAAMGEQDIDKLMPPPQMAQPQDPLTDIQLATNGMPIKAFPGQDHDAHIMIKSAFIQNPVAGASPLMANAAQVITANIREHMFLRFAERIQAMGGDPGLAAQQLAKMDIAKMEAEAQAALQNDPKTHLALAEMEQRKIEHEDNMVYKASQLAIRNRDIDVKEKMAQAELFTAGQEMEQRKKEHKDTTNAKLASEATKRFVAQAKQRDATTGESP